MHLLSSQAPPKIPEAWTTVKNNIKRLLRYARNDEKGDLNEKVSFYDPPPDQRKWEARDLPIK